MRRLPALVAALLLPVAQPVLLSAALSSAALLVAEAPAQAQTAEAVGRVAQAITVRIEGATQGSGVLVKRDGNRYTVLTAWHVVSSQGPREELDVYTPDGNRHSVEQGSIQRLGDVDLAVLSLTTLGTYEVARIGDVKSVSSGSSIYASGFPLPTSAVPIRLFRFLKGDVIANATVAIPNGYQLLYSNPTLPGMSGGAVLNAQGELIGIHGQGETDIKMSQQVGVAVKTGTNQAVPIAYYNQHSSGAAVVATSATAETADDYLAQAKALLGKEGSAQEVIRLTSRVLADKQNAEAYSYRAFAKFSLYDGQGALSDYSQAIAINPQDVFLYLGRGYVKVVLGDMQGALSDYSQAIAINPRDSGAYSSRGNVKSSMGDFQGAIADHSQAIAIDPYEAAIYSNRASAKSASGDLQGAIADYSQAIAIDPQDAVAFYARGNAMVALGDNKGAMADYSRAIAINPRYAFAYGNRGFVKSALGDKKGAIADYNKAISIDPKYADAFFNRGNAKNDLADIQGAIADYSQAIAINARDADAYVRRGMAYKLLDDLGGACMDWRAAASLGIADAAAWVKSQCE